LLDRNNSPLYIHCLNGSGVTSLAICALRKLQLWTHPTIFSEMLRFSDIHTSSERFLESFGSPESDVQITIPKSPVSWLWQGLLDAESLLPVTSDGLHGLSWGIRVQYEDRELEEKRRAREEEAIVAFENYELDNWLATVNREAPKSNGDMPAVDGIESKATGRKTPPAI